MFERLQKPFLTVETGEAYQPIRLAYHVHKMDALVAALNNLKCCEKNNNASSWNWFWRDECDDQHFESIDSFQRQSDKPVRLGSVTINDGQLFVNLTSFKRACLAVPFFDRVLTGAVAEASYADFINKVFGLDERLPHGFTELFKEEELQQIVDRRLHEYHEVQHLCETAASAEDAFSILSDYARKEAMKQLPFAERYDFQRAEGEDPDITFLGFYIFLRGRELVAIRRWFGNTGYSLADATDETMEQVFGGMNIDIIE